jgi:outer membrane lipoprotein-sorting protein
VDPANMLLRGVPKTFADRISEVLLEVTPSSQLVRIVLTEVDGATTDFRFTNPKENLEVSDRLFQFTPPPGIETIEGELGP